MEIQVNMRANLKKPTGAGTEAIDTVAEANSCIYSFLQSLLSIPLRLVHLQNFVNRS